MIPVEPQFSPARYHVLLAAKPRRRARHGSVWVSGSDAYMVTTDGSVHTVTTIVSWLTSRGLIILGPKRELGGAYLIPTDRGLAQLQLKIGKKEKV